LEDKIKTIANDLAKYVQAVITLFKEFVKNEVYLFRTINQLRALVPDGKISVRLVKPNLQTIDSANTFSTENKIFWLETRGSWFGSHLQSFTAFKLAMVLNTYSFLPLSNQIKHMENSYVIPSKMDVNMTLPLTLVSSCSPPNGKEWVQANDWIMRIKQLTGVKFKFDLSTIDCPIMAAMMAHGGLGGGDQVNLIFCLPENLYNNLKRLLEKLPQAKDKLQQLCPTGACIRVTNWRTHWEDLHKDMHDPLKNDFGGDYTSRFDNGDLVIIFGDRFTNASYIGSDLEKRL